MTITPTTTVKRTKKGSAARPLPTDRKLLALLLIVIFLFGSGTTYAVRRAVDLNGDEALLESPSQPSPAAELPVLPPEFDGKIADAFRPDQMNALPQYADPFANRSDSSTAPFVGAFATPQGSTQPTNTAAVVVAPLVPELTTRLTNWQRICREARALGRTCAPRTGAYLLAELSPMGTVQIRGQRKVWFYVTPERMSFNVEIGAQFFDGRLIDTNSDGAVFKTNSDETMMIAWTSNPDISVSPGADSTASDKHAAPDATLQPETKSKATPSTSDLDALQDAVRDRYKKQLKPLASLAPLSPMSSNRRRVFAPAFNFEKRLAGDAHALSDNEFTPRFYTIDNEQEAPLPYLAYEETARRKERQNPRQASYRKASYTYETTPEEPQQLVADKTRIAALVVATEEPSPELSAAVASTTTSSVQASTPKAKQLNPLCDAAYIGEPISVETTRPLTLSDLVRTINTSFKANIVLDSDIQNLPVNLTSVDAPWNQILRTQLDLNDLDVICNANSSLVQIAKRSKIALIEDQKRKSTAIVREVFKLRYLQPTTGGRTDLAGRVQSGANATLQSLDETIREILRAGGDTRAEFRRIPGRNEFLVAATPDQITEIRGLIDRVDRPGYQVVIRALIYSVSDDKLLDVGSQLSAVVGNAGQTNLGGFTTLPNGNQGGGSGGTPPTGGLNPGGIPTPGRNIATPSGLQASNPAGVFGITTIIGTAQFAYQLTLAQSRGLINIQSRPFGVVSDGDTFDLVSGTQIPVVTAALAGGSAFGVGQVQFIEASRIARITPQVAEMEDGKAGFVTLSIQLENNDIANVLYNGYPGVNRQSLQTVLRLRNNETAVIGGLTTDAVQRSQTKVPGLGDIPGLGWLFKRKLEQQSRARLYFAIAIEVIDQSQSIQAFPAPSDAIAAPPPPPPAQQPSPYEVKPKG